MNRYYSLALFTMMALGIYYFKRWLQQRKRIKMHINKDYIKSGNIPKMKEGETFNLSALFQSLTNCSNPYTQITLVTLSPHLIQFTVTKPLICKKKSYKIICTPEQAIVQARIMSEGLLKFPVRKMVISKCLFEQNNCKDLIIPKQFEQLFDCICFDQVIVDEEIHEVQTFFEYIITKFTTLKISFASPLNPIIIGNLIVRLHLQQFTQNIILNFKITQPNSKDLIMFTEKWIDSLPQKYQYQFQVKKQFGYPFPRNPKKCNFIGRREQISLISNDRQILTVRQQQQLGRSVIVSQLASFQFIEQITRALFLKNKGVDLEISSISSQNLVVLAQLVAYNFYKDYRLVVGHQLQLSANRLILNTIDLTQDQVMRMMKIGAVSGRYQIVMYSQLKYFQAAVDLFMRKPLIKFNYFMSLEELTPHIQILIKNIQRQCSITKLSAYSFAAILNQYGRSGYVVVNSVFHALADDP